MLAVVLGSATAYATLALAVRILNECAIGVPAANGLGFALLALVAWKVPADYPGTCPGGRPEWWPGWLPL